ncbi:MAG: LysR family transcriptional regulator [Aestuariivita sp.]|nr:LysR family transcriptional regulator [Aestuariivita sp.]
MVTDLRDLEMLVALARHKNFSISASECNISQPAFSSRIRNMEGRFNLTLVRRGNSFVGFTREGEVVLKWARKLLADAEAMNQEVKALRTDLDGKISIGVIPTAVPFAATIARTLKEKFPKVSTEIYSDSTSQIIRRLNDFSIDAAITYFEDADPDITVEIYQEGYMLVAHGELLQDYSNPIKWLDASRVPMCLLTSDMRNRQLIDRIFSKVGVTPNITSEANDFTAVLAQVVSGKVATIAPQGIAEAFFELNTIKKIKLVDPIINNRIGFSVKDQSPTPPMIKALREAVKLAL